MSGAAIALLPSEIDALAAASSAAAPDHPLPLLAVLDTIAQRAIGHRLFTVLSYEWTAGLAHRRYSSNPAAYPASGAKKMDGSPALRRMTTEGKPLLSPDAASIRRNFLDAEAIFRLDCASVLNVPVHASGRLLGQVNLLNGENHFQPGHVAFAALLGVLAAPALMRYATEARRPGG